MKKKITLLLIAFLLGISSTPHTSLAQSCQPSGDCIAVYECGSSQGQDSNCGTPCTATPGSCNTGQVCNGENVCVCQPSGICIATNPCGSTSGFDSNCGTPCTATPGTCPMGEMCNSNNECVCQPSGICLPIWPCGSSAGFDSNCGSPPPCVATPGFCPSGQYCSSNACYNCGQGTCVSENPPVPGIASTPVDKQPITADPVNIFSGEDYFSSTDFSLSGRGPKLSLFRKYRSMSTFSGMFGYGWRTDFDVNLTQDTYGNVIIYNGEGTGIYFVKNSPTFAIIIGLQTYSPSNTTTYSPSPGNYSTIIQNSDNTFTLTDKNGIITHYDINGRLSSRTDRNGNVLTFVYNPSVSGGTYIQDASGRKIVLNFDANNHVISAVDPAGKTFQYGYDANGNLASITDPTGAVTNYTYDSNHKITQFTNANSHSTYYQYDAQGRAYSTSQSNNINQTTLNYEANNTTVVTDSLGNNNTYVFNAIGLLVSRTDPLSNVTQQTWDNNMNRTSIIDARNNETNFEYDTNGNLTRITDPLGNETNMTYTPNFNLIASKTDALGNVTNFTYDAAGNLTGITDALSGSHTFAYDGYGNVITATDSLGNSTNFTYDAIGHVLRKTDALGNSTNYIYE